MSQTLHAGPPGLSVALRGEAASMRDTLHAEWTKLRTVSGPVWLLAGAIVLIVAVSAAATAAIKCRSGTACPVDTPKLSLTGIDFGQAVVAILAVLAISGEYSTGMIRITLTAMPRRSAVLAAKACDSAVAIGAVLGLLYLAPIILSVVAGDPVWSRRLERYAPMSAGLTIQDTTGLRGLPISPRGGLGVLAAWAAAALLAGGLVLRWRDA